MSKVRDPKSLMAKFRCVLIVLMIALCLTLTSCSNEGHRRGGSGGSAGVHTEERDWEKFIYQCISGVEKSDLVFYRRGERVTGKEVARQMQSNLRAILRNRTVYDPFGQNVATVLVLITTHEGVWRDGLTDRPQAYEVEVNGRRITVYEWLKQQLGVSLLPGEGEYVEEPKPGHETEITSELVSKWEMYIAECIRVVREAEGCKYDMRGKICSPEEAAVILEANRGKALDYLRTPSFLVPEQEEDWSLTGWVGVIQELIMPPMPEDPGERTRWGRSPEAVISPSGERVLLDLWLKSKVGEPPPMPKLKKKGKGKACLETPKVLVCAAIQRRECDRPGCLTGKLNT